MAPMTHTRRSRLGRTVVAALGVAALLAVGLVAATPANAATEQMNFTLTGTVSIGARDIALPEGSLWSADVDTATGAITNGQVSIPGISSVEMGVDVVTTISDAAPSTGTLDLATGAIELTSSYALNISLPTLSFSCDLSPIDATPSTTGGSDLAGSPATATLVDEGFSVPAATVSATCPIAIATAVSGGLGAPTSETSLSLTITQSVTDVYLVHGLNLDGQTAATDGGSDVTVCSGDTVLVPDFQFGDVVGPVPLTSGEAVDVQVYAGADNDCADPEGALLIEQSVTPDGAAVALVATSPPGDALAPELAAFPLDLACFKAGQGSLTAAHAAAAPEVDVQVDGTSAGLLTYGTSLTAPLAAGSYDVAVLLGDAPVLGPVTIPVTTAVATVVFAVGNQPLPDESTSPVVAISLDIDLAACAVTPPPAAPPAAAATTQPVFTG